MLMRRQSYNQNKLFARIFFTLHEKLHDKNIEIMLMAKVQPSLWSTEKKLFALTANAKI